MGSEDGGFFERIFGAELTAEHFISAQQLKWKVDEFIGQFMTRKRRKHRVGNWQNDYADLVGKNLVDERGDVLDQVIPQSAIFLCAILFEDHVRLHSRPVEELLEVIADDVLPLASKIQSIITFAKTHPQAANRSWLTLLKSQPFFENYVSCLKGRSDSSRGRA